MSPVRRAKLARRKKKLEKAAEVFRVEIERHREAGHLVECNIDLVTKTHVVVRCIGCPNLTPG